MCTLALITDRLGRTLRFLWGGWAGLAALCLLAALWQAGHEAYGGFILSAPLETLAEAARLLQSPEAQALALQTLRRAGAGFALVALGGSLLGIIAGYHPALMRLARPLITILLGVPPIAWIVLAMIWFGGSDATVMSVILIAALPITFAGAAQGAATRDRQLSQMAEAFGVGWPRRFLTIELRQVLEALFPTLVLALGTSVKVAVMAELLANAGGIGGALAEARMNIDITGALAWVLIAVGLLIALEYGVIQPARAELERWRDAARPWGIKR